MRKSDFTRIIGASSETDYSPVAGMLQNGYGFVGYFNSRLNEGLEETLVVINVRLADLREKAGVPGVPRIADFNEFVEQIVVRSYEEGKEPISGTQDIYGKSIPLVALNYDQIAVVYPISQIHKLMAVAAGEKEAPPSFLDFENKSVILKALRAKLW
jgi:hypothetical protein